MTNKQDESGMIEPKRKTQPHTYSEVKGVNCCHLLSDTAIHPPDVYLSFHSKTLNHHHTPGWHVPSELCMNHQEYPAPMSSWSAPHSAQNTMLTISEVKMLIHSHTDVIHSCSVLPCIHGGFCIFLGRSWVCSPLKGYHRVKVLRAMH